MTIKIHTHQFVLHPTGGIYWKEKQYWLLADVHLGKVAHFRKNGIPVPRNAEGFFYQKISRMFGRSMSNIEDSLSCIFTPKTKPIVVQ